MNNYEFSKEEEEVFTDLIKWMLILSVLLVFAGTATIIQFIEGDTGFYVLISGITWAILGFTLYFPIDNFKRITTTEGSDIKELMVGFKELNKGWFAANIITGLNRLMLLVLLIVIIFD
ncbi:MAG: hypothetical protein ACXAD7_15285 [Candidatus Kariarchaeaceae archaeon]|jgi:hypothetical protein